MKLGFAPEDEAFRAEVRAFVDANLDPLLRRKLATGMRLEKADHVRWAQALDDKGWLVTNWPVAYGGSGWSPLRKMIFDDELQLAGAPRGQNPGVAMLGPVLIRFGSDAQKAEYLPAIRRATTWWAQGFSEPQAGSDLASLRTSARLEGDTFVVNGHKIWTTMGHVSDKIFMLVRTDPDAPKPQMGISFLLIDLDTPGITIRPIRGLDGGDDLNEVFFDDVRVPAANLVGEINLGWTYAKFLLGNERTGIAGIPASRQLITRIRKTAETRRRNGRPFADDPVFKAALAALEIDLMVLDQMAMRLMTAPDEGATGAEASLLKIRGSEIRQALQALLLDVAGPAALVQIEEAMIDPDYVSTIDQQGAAAANYLDSRKLSIFGGANEIQRNILARAVLRL